MADMERRFEAAVKVIRSMPKKGPYQPSNETMLKFYGYFKQAKEGPCTEPKPSFWDVVKKAKWEAWSALGSISNEEAMECYINELKQVMETMPATEEMADFRSVLKSFYEAVYEPSGEEPPHILRIFKKTTTAPEKTNGHDIPKDITIVNPKSYEKKSETFENERIKLSLEKISKPREPDLNDQINGDHVDAEFEQDNFHQEINNHDSNNIMNGLIKSDEHENDMVNSLEDVCYDIENGSHTPLEEDAHNTSLQPKPLYIVEVSNKKKDLPDKEKDLEDLLNDNDSGQNSQLQFVESTIRDDAGQPDQPSASSDESEEEEFCDSIDPEHLSVLQSGLVDTHKPNSTTESHSSTSTSSPDHIPTSSLTESDISDLENEGHTSTKRNTSTPSEKKPQHVTFNVEENNSMTKIKHKDSKGRRRVNEPHIAPTSSKDLKTSHHLNGGILKVKQAGSGYRGGDSSKAIRQPPTSSGFSQRGQGGGVGSSAGNSLQDSRMMHGRNTGHSDSDSDDTNPNGESCDSCGEREEINERIMIALERLQQDMSRVLRRLGTMEDVMALRQERLQHVSAASRREVQGPWWRQFIPSKTVAFLILWPFIINLIFYSWRRRKAQK